jgi:hypothetical protein
MTASRAVMCGVRHRHTAVCVQLLAGQQHGDLVSANLLDRDCTSLLGSLRYIQHTSAKLTGVLMNVVGQPCDNCTTLSGVSCAALRCNYFYSALICCVKMTSHLLLASLRRSGVQWSFGGRIDPLSRAIKPALFINCLHVLCMSMITRTRVLCVSSAPCGGRSS